MTEGDVNARGARELTLAALRHYKSETSQADENATIERLVDALETQTIDELFGQTREQIEEAWQSIEAEGAPEFADAGYEVFPRGSGEPSALAGLVWQSGALYAINRGVLHTLGLALGVDTYTDGEHKGRVRSLFVCRTSDPEGITFDELSREQGRGRFANAELASVLTSLRELDAELDAELKARADGTHGRRGEVDAAVLDVLKPHERAIGRGIVATELGLTRAQMSASLLRLTSAELVTTETVDGETLYKLAVRSDVPTGEPAP